MMAAALRRALAAGMLDEDEEAGEEAEQARAAVFAALDRLADAEVIEKECLTEEAREGVLEVVLHARDMGRHSERWPRSAGKEGALRQLEHFARDVEKLQAWLDGKLPRETVDAFRQGGPGGLKIIDRLDEVLGLLSIKIEMARELLQARPQRKPERHGKRAAFLVACTAATVFHQLAGRRPTIVVSWADGAAGGPFLAFVAELLAGLGVGGNAEHAAREAIDMLDELIGPAAAR